MAVMTVKGVIPKRALGVTSPHEHAYIDIRNQYTGSREPESDGWSGKFTRKSLNRLMHDPYIMRDNLILDDEALGVEEIFHAVRAGLRTFVDVTPACVGRNPKMLMRLSEKTGLHVVAGCGYYTYDAHPEFVETMDKEMLSEIMIRELTDGIDSTAIRAGIIGELGTSKDIHPREEKVLRAAASAHHATGAPVMVHLYPWNNNGLKVLDIFDACGVDPGRVCLCHADVPLDLSYMSELLRRGAYVEFDDFGKEFTTNLSYGAFPSDDERLRVFYELTDAGYLDHLLASCDVCLKVLYVIYGGKGYAHLLTGIAQKIKRQRSDAQSMLDMVLIQNPAKYLNNPRLDRYIKEEEI